MGAASSSNPALVMPRGAPGEACEASHSSSIISSMLPSISIRPQLLTYPPPKWEQSLCYALRKELQCAFVNTEQSSLPATGQTPPETSSNWENWWGLLGTHGHTARSFGLWLCFCVPSWHSWPALLQLSCLVLLVFPYFQTKHVFLPLSSWFCLYSYHDILLPYHLSDCFLPTSP